MKKSIKSILNLLMATLVCLTCFDNVSYAEEKTRTVVDMVGNTVILPAVVEKYAIVYSSAVPMCAMLDPGLSHMVACPALYTDWTYELFPDLDNHSAVMDKRAVTAEQVIECGTEVLFWSSSSNMALVESLQNLGIACVNVTVNNADEMMQAMQIIVDTLGTDYAATQMGKYIDFFEKCRIYAENCATKIPDDSQKRVLVLSGFNDTTGFGISSYEAYWCNLSGLDYIVPSQDGASKVTLTMEQIFEFDPDIIVLEGYYDQTTVSVDPAWSSLRAVQNGMLFSSPSVLNTWSKPGAEAPLQYVWAINTFYPEFAGELDAVTETIMFYSEFYGYEMTVEHAEMTLSGRRIIFE